MAEENNQSKDSSLVTLEEPNKESVAVSMEGSRVKLFVCAGGIFICYFYYGILQEKITKSKYGSGEGAERFTFTLSLVLFQCFFNALFAKCAMYFVQTKPDTTAQKYYIVMTLSYLGAMLASFQSLQYISYPTQVLGKSAKPIPIMILGVLFARKRYPPAKYGFVLLIVMGVALFLMKDKKLKTVDSDHTFGYGELLLIVSLMMDGMTGATQDRMRAEHQTQSHPMMYAINSWSMIFLSVLLIASGELSTFLPFVQRHPVVIIHMLTFAAASALGQNFIFMTVSNFGPLTCSIMTTTRKFFTILGSVILFDHTMSSRQWLGTVLVFIGLALDSAFGKKKKVPTATQR